MEKQKESWKKSEANGEIGSIDRNPLIDMVLEGCRPFVEEDHPNIEADFFYQTIKCM